jgi:hypothetical protein
MPEHVLRSGQTDASPFPAQYSRDPRGRSAGRSEFGIEAGQTYQTHEPTTSSHELALLSPLTA